MLEDPGRASGAKLDAPLLGSVTPTVQSRISNSPTSTINKSVRVILCPGATRPDLVPGLCSLPTDLEICITDNFLQTMTQLSLIDPNSRHNKAQQALTSISRVFTKNLHLPLA